MKLLVTGAAGMLGRAVCAAGAGHFQVVGVDLPDGDLTRPDHVQRIWERAQPDWVIHCAAYTDVDGAETDRDLALAVNGTATAELVRACEATGAGLTYLSSDYVFDGQSSAGYHEDAVRNPLGFYGYTKACGEEAMADKSDRWQIVRTSWLFGPGPKNFVLTIRRLLAEREELQVVDDQVGNPTYAPDLAATLVCLVERGESGIFHATNDGSCSWFQFAQEIARVVGTEPDRIKPCSSALYPTPARRPACSVLHRGRLQLMHCPEPPTWQDAVRRYCRWLEQQEALQVAPS
ncbi:MAG: dTDP-4-dehydrorhamnose reductase [bacterium]